MKTAITVGTFDGVHRGHQEVVACLMREAKKRGLIPQVVTFDRHPLSIIRPERVPQMLTTTARRDMFLRREGVNPLTVAFTDELRHLTAAEWMRILRDRYDAALLVVGYDNTFGSDGLNLSLDDFIKIGDRLGIKVVEAPVLPGISSSAVRKAVLAGDIDRANEMLGRHYRLEGTVAHGNGIGRNLGWPTANLQTPPGMCVPGAGVYAAEAVLPDGQRRPAMVNIGVHPTVGEAPQATIEAHILDYSGDIYYKPLSLIFHTRLRDEKKFGSIDALRKAIADDAAAVRIFFSNKHK